MLGVSVASLVAKTKHYNKDERYMATSNLCELLKRHAANDTSSTGSRLDSSSQRKICNAVLQLLNDKSNDVQAVAVKTLGVLLTTVEEEQVLAIAKSLADNVLDPEKKNLRDVYAIGLRKLVESIPSAMGDVVSHRLIGRVLEDSRTNSTAEDAANGESIVLPCLDILTEIVTRFGATAVSVTRQHESILHTCLHLVVADTSSPVVKKRAGTTLGCLSSVISDAMLATSPPATSATQSTATTIVIIEYNMK